MQNISRRVVLKGGAALGAATLVGFPELFGLKGIGRVRAQGTMPDDDLQTIINLASTAELFATTHYLAATRIFAQSADTMPS